MMKYLLLKTRVHIVLGGFVLIGAVFSLVYVMAQKYVNVGVKIVSSYTGSLTLQSSGLLYRNGYYYISSLYVDFFVEANDSSEYSFYGDMVLPLSSFYQSGSFSALHTVTLTTGDGEKQVSILLERQYTGFSDVYHIDGPLLYLDRVGPIAVQLSMPFSGKEIYGSNAFSWLPTTDAGVGLKGYQYMIASDPGMTDVKYVGSTTGTQFGFDVTALATGVYYWKVIAEDYLGWTTSSETFPFVVEHPGAGGVSPPSGGAGAYTLYDVCPDGDFSVSYYDGLCSASEWVNYEQNDALKEYHESIWKYEKYGEELYLAYKYAYKHGMTTMWPIDKSELFKPLVRKEYAKMVSQFAMSILKLEPTVNTGCVFSDVAEESAEFQYFMEISCELGLMGLQYDGVPAKEFRPNLPVSRAMFGTVLSRLLFGSMNNGNSESRYEDHLLALKKANIMHLIDFPLTPEMRGYAMLMLKRADEYGYADIDAFRASQFRRK